MARTYEQGSFIEGAESSGLWAAFLVPLGRFWEQMGAREVSEPRPGSQNQTAPPHTPQCLCYHHCMPLLPCTGVPPHPREGGAAWATWVRCHPGSCYGPAWIQFPRLPGSSCRHQAPPATASRPPELHDRCAHSPPHTPHECTRLGQTPNLCLLRSAGL